jgi:hypothetical protein
VFRIIALDPGGTTGWYSYTADVITVEGTTEYYEEKWACGWLGPDEHHQELYTFLELQHCTETIVVCESFEYRNRARPGLDLISKEYIGITRLFGQERSVPVVFQTAATGKGFGSDEKLQRIGILQRPVSVSPQKHINDAARHLLTFMCTGVGCPVALRERTVRKLRPTNF